MAGHRMRGQARRRLVEMAMCVGAVGLTGWAVADGGINPGAGTPGWEWGRANCGPHTAGLCTEDECRQCCLDEYNRNWHTQTWLDQCRSYCAAVNWSLWCQ